MPLHVATHPLISHKLTLLRDVKTSSSDFRKLLQEVTFYLGYEATRTLGTGPVTVTTPMGVPSLGSKVNETVAIIPILRAGLGMADGMMDLIPFAAVHHIGMYRAKESLLPVQYYNRLPRDQVCDVAYICDPCIATANTIHAVCSIVKRWGAKRIVVIATIGAKAGVDRLLALHPDVEVFIGQIDDILDVNGYIIPGIGDAGDRQFGTPLHDVPVTTNDVVLEEEAATKRKRESGEA